MKGAADVIVCDGFTGNIFLKTLEGTASFLMHELKDIFFTNLSTKLSALILKKHLAGMQKKVDPREIGGTALLGIQKPVIKAHGLLRCLCHLQRRRTGDSVCPILPGVGH